MKLYYSPGVCSLSPHIVLREGGFDFDLIRVDLGTKKTEHGDDYNAISEKSYVPLLKLDNGDVLTEGVAIVQYLADQRPAAGLAPANGTLDRVRLQETLNFLSTEVHKSFSVLFYPDKFGTQAVSVYREKLARAFTLLAEKLETKPYLMGERFTVADAYCFTLLSWTTPTKIDLSTWPSLVRYQQRIAARPKVRDALKAEGLIDAKAA